MKSPIVLVLGLVAGSAAAKPLVKEARQEPATEIEGRAGTGIGAFQDIQVPLNEEFGVRADGHGVKTEGATHIGVPIYGGIAVKHAAGSLSYGGALDVLRISASTGPAETQSATYSRFDIGGDAAYHFKLAGMSAALGGGAGIRRSVFGNGSSGHYFQAPMLHAAASLGARGMTFGLEAAYAPSVAFGYYNGSMFSGDAFKKSKTSLAEIGFSSSYLVREAVWLDLGLTRETAAAVIEDLGEYDGFGLQVTPGTSESSRSLSLATTVAKIGFHKDF